MKLKCPSGKAIRLTTGAGDYEVRIITDLGGRLPIFYIGAASISKPYHNIQLSDEFLSDLPARHAFAHGFRVVAKDRSKAFLRIVDHLIQHPSVEVMDETEGGPAAGPVGAA